MLSNAKSRRGLPCAMEPVYGLVLRSMVSGGSVNRTGVKWIPHLAIILIISVYFSGCIDFNSHDNIFIKEWSTEPANVKSEEKFSLHTVISNPTKYDDEAYIQYAFDSSCLSSDKINLLIPVGTIRAGETKKVYKYFPFLFYHRGKP